MGLSRGELREELQACEQRLDKRLDTRFDKLLKDINDAFGKTNKALSVILARVKDLTPPT